MMDQFPYTLIFTITKDENVSSLKPFDTVEVLGLWESGEMLVVINPAYQIPCWASMADFYLDEIDLSILPVIVPE